MNYYKGGYYMILNNLERRELDNMKAFYRNAFASMLPMINISYFLKLVGIQKSNFSLFMKGSENDGYISIEKLNELMLCISEYIEIKKVA